MDAFVKPKNFLITSFFKEKIIDPRAFIFPPILREEIFKMKPRTGNYVLSYISSKSEELIEIFEKIDKRFIVYGFNRDEKRKNITFKKASSKNFLDDLANCEGVVANAGFSLMTEALYLGKPYLALPIKGHFEQILNARYLEKLGYGKYLDSPDKEKVESFLYNLKNYRKNLKKYPRKNNSEIFEKIDELVEEYASNHI